MFNEKNGSLMQIIKKFCLQSGTQMQIMKKFCLQSGTQNADNEKVPSVFRNAIKKHGTLSSGHNRET